MARRLGILTALLGMFAMLSMLPEPVVRWPEKTYVLSAVQQDSMCVELGRALFYDPILSRDSTISCSSCHSSYVAFTHVDHKVSHGIDDRIGRRNAPALMNLAWSNSFMWDGAVNHLDMQPLAPITHALEMDEQLPHVLSKLQTYLQQEHCFLPYRQLYKHHNRYRHSSQLTLPTNEPFHKLLLLKDKGLCC